MSDSQGRPKRRKRASATAGRSQAGAAGTSAAEHATPPAGRESGTCRRCGTIGPVGEDGFCDKCEKALEQACL